MVAKTGSTYISESITDIIKIRTTNQRFSTTVSSNRMYLGDSKNDRQPEMAAETAITQQCLYLEHQGQGLTSLSNSNIMGLSTTNTII